MRDHKYLRPRSSLLAADQQKYHAELECAALESAIVEVSRLEAKEILKKVEENTSLL